MKARHWVNLIGVSLAAGLLTFLALRWGIASYAEPTCRRYADTHGLTYVGYDPPDPSANTGTSHLSRDGNCQLRDSNGELKTESLVGASGPENGAPLLVSLALSWQLVFCGSFFVVALVLAAVTRAFTPKKAAA